MLLLLSGCRGDNSVRDSGMPQVLDEQGGIDAALAGLRDGSGSLGTQQAPTRRRSSTQSKVNSGLAGSALRIGEERVGQPATSTPSTLHRPRLSGPRSVAAQSRGRPAAVSHAALGHRLRGGETLTGLMRRRLRQTRATGSREGRAASAAPGIRDEGPPQAQAHPRSFTPLQAYPNLS